MQSGTDEWMWSRSRYLEIHLSHCHSVHHKSHMDWPGIEPGPSRWEAGDWPPERWQISLSGWFGCELSPHHVSSPCIQQYASAFLCWIRPWRWLKKGETCRRLTRRCITLYLNISAGVGVCMYVYGDYLSCCANLYDRQLSARHVQFSRPSVRHSMLRRSQLKRTLMYRPFFTGAVEQCGYYARLTSDDSTAHGDLCSPSQLNIPLQQSSHGRHGQCCWS